VASYYELTSWTFDCSVTRLGEAIGLARSVHQAVIRTGSSIIDKNDLRLVRGHRIVQLKQGPDLALFTQPGVLFRLGLWLTEVLRDRVTGVSISRRSKKKSLPLILACLDERDQTYLMIGLNESMDFGDVRKK
jgi:cell division control protein 45